MWTTIIAGIVGAGAGQVVRIGIQRFLQRNQAVDDWYEESLYLISYGHGICLSAKDRSILNYGDISENSSDISQRLRGHVNPHPEGVDGLAVDQVRQLAVLFRKMSAVTEATEEQSTEDTLSEIFEMGQREQKKNQDVDMGEAVDESTEYSSIMDHFFERSEIQPKSFGSQFERQFSDAESIEELTKKMGSQISGTSVSMEEIIDTEFISEEWDDSLSLGIRMYLQIASNLCEESINHISEVSNMESAT